MKNTITFIMVSNRRGSTKKMVISAARIKAMAVVTGILAVVGAAVLADYVGLLIQSVENKQLRAENSWLHGQFQVVEGKLNSLENSLERVKSFSAKLRLITDVDSQDRTLKLAIGPLPKVGQSLNQADVPGSGERLPASELNEKDVLFYEKPPLEEGAGELAVEGQRDYASLSIRIDQAVKDTQLREQGILELWEALSERQSLLNATPNIRPVKGWFTSRFGYRVSPFTGRPVMHAGLDIAASPGSLVYAPADGVISFAGYDPSYGQLVSIDHGYGVVTRFGHNSRVFVAVGQKVRRRDVVSAVGNTGRSTGPHCHYEVRVNSIPVDPANYILDE